MQVSLDRSSAALRRRDDGRVKRALAVYEGSLCALIPLPVTFRHCVCYNIRYVDSVYMAVKTDNEIVWYVGVSLPVYKLLLSHTTNIHFLIALTYQSKCSYFVTLSEYVVS